MSHASGAQGASAVRPPGYVDTPYLGAVAAFVQRSKQRTYDLMRVCEGQAVLDLGCGPGTDTVALAGLVGPRGRVVGVDHDAAMVAEAARRARAAGARAAGARHIVADAAALPLPDAAFDACRSERLFQHLPDPAAALREMIRVTKPGGWIVVFDTDGGAVSINTAELDLERRLMRFTADRCQNGYVGRRLYRLFKQHGLRDVTPDVVALCSTDYAFARSSLVLDEAEREALAAGVVTPEELRRWRASLEEAERAGVFFATITMALVAGRTG